MTTHTHTQYDRHVYNNAAICLSNAKPAFYTTPEE